MRQLKAAAVRAALSTFCSFVLLTTAYARADESAARPFDITPQSLATALSEFARQSQQEILFSPDVVARKLSSGVRGTMQPLAALRLLLKDSALSFTTTPNGAILVGSPSGSTGTSRISEEEKGPPMTTSSNRDQEAPSSFSDRFRLAQVDQGKATDSATVSKESKSSDRTSQNRVQLEEIIVTAQKRAERLEDVPASISAISGERLESMQVNSLADLADYVPGLSVMGAGSPGYRTIVVRGLNTSYNDNTTSSLVATYIDDLPVGASAGSRGAQYGLDLQPYDIEQIEVLKGPQGTLYGANAMAGLVKYVLRKPDLRRFDARVGTDVRGVKHSGGADWAVHAAVNLPIVTDRLAVRLSGFNQHVAGYINNIGTGESNANHSTERGGRATLLWQATDDLTVRATVLAQDIELANMTVVSLNGTTLQPLYGPQTVSTHFPESFLQKTRIYSLGVDWNLRFATLTSVSGWSKMSSTMTQDLTNPFGSYVAIVDPAHADALARWTVSNPISKFVEEVRLTSPEHQRIQWILGGYYTKEDGGEDDTIPTFTPTLVPLPIADNIVYSSGVSSYKESAAFANVTYQFTDRFDLSAGGRHSAYTQHSCPGFSGGVFGSGLLPCTSLPSTGISVWMANTRFHLSQAAMLYARVATGYRPGSGCPTCGSAKLGTPGIVDPDKTTNYELGFKGQFLDQRLQLDLSAFHIDWTHIQLPLLTPSGFGYPGNGGRAISSGFELTTAYQFIKSLRLNATLAYTDAHLTDDAPGAFAKAGDQLPDSPRWTGSMTAAYDRPVSEHTSLLIGGSYRYRDGVVNQFAHNAHPFPMGPQHLVDLYTGFVMKSVTLRVYGMNVFNNRSYVGAIYVNDPTTPRFVPVQPRTIGLSVDYQF